MKKLSELKISPAPWKVVPYGESTNSKVATHGDVEFANGESAFMKEGGVNLQKIADARLMAAAPDMCAALWDLLFGDIGTANCRKCKGAELGNCKTCHLGKARFALEKAAGEGVAK